MKIQEDAVSRGVKPRDRLKEAYKKRKEGGGKGDERFWDPKRRYHSPFKPLGAYPYRRAVLAMTYNGMATDGRRYGRCARCFRTFPMTRSP